MASFSPEDPFTGRLDWSLVQNSPIARCGEAGLLQATADALDQLGYAVKHFDAAGWTSEDSLWADFASRLQFANYFGNNWAALDDCLGDVANGEYGWDASSATGLVLAIHRFGSLPSHIARVLLDILAQNARAALLVGHRMIGLIECPPHLRLDPVGAMEVERVSRGWVDSSEK